MRVIVHEIVGCGLNVVVITNDFLGDFTSDRVSNLDNLARLIVVSMGWVVVDCCALNLVVEDIAVGVSHRHELA